MTTKTSIIQINDALIEIAPEFIVINIIECLVFAILSMYVVRKIRASISIKNLVMIIMFNLVFLLKSTLYIL
jgi:hypothetical protein